MAVMVLGTQRQIYQLFAGLFKYPWPEHDLTSETQACQRFLADHFPEAAEELDGFVAFVEQEPPARIEERYTSTFDLNPVVSPYVGYHLFGESYQRGALMARLKEIYAQHGFSAGTELPDHLSILLCFLARCENDELAAELIDRCLKPALERMEKIFDQTENVYGGVIRSLRRVVESEK